MNVWIPGRFPSLNEIIGSQSRGKNNWNAYNALKVQWYGQIKLICQAKRMPLQDPTYATFLFCEPTRARDPDNLVAGGVKLLLDSFVGAEVLSGDGWASILGFIGYWTHTKGKAGCLVRFHPERLATKAEMLADLEKESGYANQENRS